MHVNKSGLYKPFALKSWLTVYRAFSRSSPTGGNSTRLMHKIILAIATLQSIITFVSAIWSDYPPVRTSIYIRACRVHKESSWNIEWRKICLVPRSGFMGRIFIGFSYFSNSQVWVGISASRVQDSLLTSQWCFAMLYWHCRITVKPRFWANHGDSWSVILWWFSVFWEFSGLSEYLGF